MILYHGTNDKFNKFSKDKIGSNTGVTSVGFFFTDSYETAISYGDIVLKCDVDLGNYIECDFNNTCHTFLIDKEYTPSELAVKIAELNKYLKSHSDIRGAFDIDLDIEYDEETDEPIYPDNYWDEYEIQDYLDSLGTYDHQCDDKIDSIICKNVKDNMGFGGNSCNNYIVFDEDRIKILDENILTEKFEEIADDMFATNSAYDIINQMKNKPKPIRLVYDKDINYYFIGDAYLYIHQDILEEAFYQGFYPDMLSSSEARDKVDNYEVLLFAFYPSENHRQDLEKSSDGYTRKYVYDFGTIYSHEMTPLEDFEIYNILGEPKKKETILENIYSKLNKELNNFF